jgi:hypothetical protein
VADDQHRRLRGRLWLARASARWKAAPARNTIHVGLDHSAADERLQDLVLLSGDIEVEQLDRDQLRGEEDAPAGAAAHLDQMGALEHRQSLTQRRLGDTLLLDQRRLVQQAIADTQLGPLDPLNDPLDRALGRPLGRHPFCEWGHEGGLGWSCHRSGAD